ncbi:hypothetical protein ABEW24_06395 [Paenibacillus jamilae]|uniref:hypothetical protein n=1 Tax=Paenibacillus TaxID=44249 RepID=UPI00077C6FA5|nr:hypothetical protein [Paenibacillus polymyxa]KYG93731.1 hypothetical protein AZE31_07740 [Paenibacillus polymyxa]
MLSSHTPSPKEQQQLIQSLCEMNLQVYDWRCLARSIDQNPEDVFGEGTTNPQKADSIVTTAVRYGTSLELTFEIERLRSNSARLGSNRLSKLDTQIAFQLSNLYSVLLEQLDSINAIEESDTSTSDKSVAEDFTKFHDKLKNKAKFSPSNQTLAVRSKNDNGVLKRKAKKLGFDDHFVLLNQKVQKFYSKRILVRFPPDQYNADYRLNELVNELFNILPEEYQVREDIEDQIYGVIFDTTFQCYIFNE